MSGSKLGETGQGEGRIKDDTQFVAEVPGWMVVQLSDICQEEGKGKRGNGV